MGNCQAIDAAALVIRHPDGRIDRLYWPVTASEVMKMNPGHYVSLIVPLPEAAASEDDNNQEARKAVRFTRVKLLRPADTLALGHAYRLVTSQEVMKVLRANKYAKKKRQQLESAECKVSDFERLCSGRKLNREEGEEEGEKEEQRQQVSTSLN